MEAMFCLWERLRIWGLVRNKDAVQVLRLKGAESGTKDMK